MLLEKFKNENETQTQLVYVPSVPDGRPIPSKRLFTSTTVEKLIVQIGSKIADPVIRQIFSNCLPNTLDTTVYYHAKVKDPPSGLILPYTYLVTGDIGAMWLRDSAHQVSAYLTAAKDDPILRDLILGVINSQAEMIELYPYANAYFPLAHWNSGITLNQSDFTADDIVSPGYEKDQVFEAKYELDSLAAFLYLSKIYTEETGDISYLDNPHWLKAVTIIEETLRGLQNGTLEESKTGAAYKFTRLTRTQSETTNLNGFGNPVKRCGLIRSAFRPSDDSTILQYLIPSNAMTTVGMEGVAKILTANNRFPLLAENLTNFATEIRAAINKHAIVAHPIFGDVYAYEVDCYGSHVFMDDTNFPSLLSFPKFGYLEKDDTVYQNTRKYILSEEWNPYFAAGKYPGVGSPHTGLQKPWPMAQAMQALTSNDEVEILEMLNILRNTTAGTGFMHESYDVDNPESYTRAWFAWANSVFGDLILYLDKNYPHILATNFSSLSH